MIRGDYVAEIFDIQVCRKPGRANQIAEHHRELAAFRVIPPQRFNGCSVVGDGPEYLATVAQQDSQLLQVLIRQVGKHAEINAVGGKALGVLPEIELRQPVRNLFHQRPRSELDLV